MKKIAVLFPLAVAAVLASPASLGQGLAYGRSQAPAPLEGTWDVAITPYFCSTGVPIPNSTFRSRVTINPGGTMNESTTNPSFQAGQRGPGQGAWERTGRDSYRVVFEAFINFTSVVTPPTPPRYQRGTQRVDQYIEMNGLDAWNSSAVVSFRDEAGNPLNAGCMTAVGSRQPF
jgi:hypothetical protein